MSHGAALCGDKHIAWYMDMLFDMVQHFCIPCGITKGNARLMGFWQQSVSSGAAGVDDGTPFHLVAWLVENVFWRVTFVQFKTDMVACACVSNNSVTTYFLTGLTSLNWHDRCLLLCTGGFSIVKTAQ
jgi:chitinase